MNTLHKTEAFDAWLQGLRDIRGRAKILVRLDCAALGNFGDAAPVGCGVYEMRVDYGPGYRIYYARESRVIYLLLNGGDKSTQAADIRQAKAIWEQTLKE